MDVEFARDDLDRLETDPAYTAGFAQGIVRSYRKVMQHIRAAPDERDFYASRGMRFEKLQGKRSHQHSFRLNDQWRLVVELEGKGNLKKVRVIGIEDYH